MTLDTPDEALRAWAKGLYPLEAATELLIRGGFAQFWRPWVREREHGGLWIDFDAIEPNIGALSGGEKRFLRIAAALGSPVAVVSLEDNVAGLDRGKVDLVLAAIAHAAGTHEGVSIVVDEESGTASFGDPHKTLHPWPES